jgi:cytoskeletal protein CcmA (bactofilin family)
MEGSGQQTVINEDVEVVGTIKAGSNLCMDGKLNGDLSCSNDVTIGKSAVTKGNISASSVTVAGQVTGNIMAKDRIELKAAARINGDIKAKRLTVEDGVSFVGKAEVNPSGVSVARSTPSDSSSGDKADSATDTSNQSSGEKGKGGALFGKK